MSARSTRDAAQYWIRLPPRLPHRDGARPRDPVAASAHPGGLPDGARSVVVAVPVPGADERVVMGAYWTVDHWSDRITYLVQGSQSVERLRARDLEAATQGVRAAGAAGADAQ